MNGLDWQHMELAGEKWLWLWLLIPLLALWYFAKRKEQNAALRISATQAFVRYRGAFVRMKPLLYALRLSAISLVILALARPRTQDVTSDIKVTKGVDMVMAIDLSTSMLTQDLKPNRLEALKAIAERFVKHRKGDRIGVVAYAGEAFTQSPVTADHRIVQRAIADLQYGYLQDGTAIGLGLGTAVNRLKNSQAQSKVIVLLTDGVNNAGAIDPITMAQIAREKGIKVYTIGVGSNGYARMPAINRDGSLVYTRAQVEIDEALLKEIAQITGGQYFRATNNERFQEIYAYIDKLEQTEYREFKYYNYVENFRPLVSLALFFLVVEIALRWSVFKTFA
ncbi:MAG: VWA domain-containing protein [Flavobacteriales bacterium]